MIIGFLGKGGSGKSTVSTFFAKFLAEQKKTVLAIDADVNMDMTYNLLGNEMHPNLFGESLPALLSECGLTEKNNYRDVFTLKEEPKFSLSPKDAYTEAYSAQVSDTLSLMTAGSHTLDILHDVSCGHSLGTPLKVYLPFLCLNKNEWVVVDEKAGADAVTTGIPAGFDVAVIVVEPRPQSIQVAKTLRELLSFYGTSSLYVGNKKGNEADKKFIMDGLGEEPAIFLNLDTTTEQTYQKEMHELLEKIESLKISESRKSKCKNKMKRNTEYVSREHLS